MGPVALPGSFGIVVQDPEGQQKRDGADQLKMCQEEFERETQEKRAGEMADQE